MNNIKNKGIDTEKPRGLLSDCAILFDHRSGMN